MSEAQTQHDRDSAELRRLAQEVHDLKRWKSTNAPRLAMLQEWKARNDHAYAKAIEAGATLQSERDANAILTYELDALKLAHQKLTAERDQLAGRLAQQSEEPTPEDIDLQDWAGMDGACAFHLIDRHAEGWDHAGRLMQAWRMAQPAQPGWVSVPVDLLNDAIGDAQDGLQQHILSYGERYKAHRITDYKARIARLESLIAAAQKQGDKP